MSTFQVLHISDLHISTDREFDRSVVLEPLIKRVIEDMKSGFKPEVVVVTGDIAYSGIKKEYELAKTFFDKLLAALGLPDKRLFLVPGNHDVYRKIYSPKDIPVYENMAKLNDELENEDYRADLLSGMSDYFDFVESNYPHLKSKRGKLIPFVYSYNADCGKRIGLVGLNSAWMCRKSPDKEEIAIGEYQVNKAMKELKEADEHDLIINIFHHPLNWLWPVDRKICKNFFNRTVALSGHIHDAEGGCAKDLQDGICEFYAGASYTGSESPASNRFQYITFDWKGNKIRLDYRKFDIVERKWCLEGEKRYDGTATFDMPGSGIKITDTPAPIPQIPEAPAKQDMSSSPKKRDKSLAEWWKFWVFLIVGLLTIITLTLDLPEKLSKATKVVTDDSSKKADKMVQPLSGFIRDGNNYPLPGVTVSLPQYGLTYITDDLGRFEFKVKAARQESVDLMALKEGYVTYDAFATLGNRGFSFTMKKEEK